VVQPRIGAFPEIISATGGGLCYDPADPDGLTGSLKRLLLDSGAAHQLGQTGRVAIRKEYNIHTTAERILAVYKQCLEPFPP
jgi:glycosyltransferase involved in cell wall biosynthesis